MYTCRICGFAIEADDALCMTAHGWALCLQCYSRETAGDQARVSRRLRREINHEEPALAVQRLGRDSRMEAL